MTTLREDLEDNEFDFANGRVLFQSDESEPRYLNKDDPIFDAYFYEGFGGADNPRIIAEDKDYIYFYSEYDGATWIDRIRKDIDAYRRDDKGVPCGFGAGYDDD